MQDDNVRIWCKCDGGKESELVTTIFNLSNEQLLPNVLQVLQKVMSPDQFAMCVNTAQQRDKEKQEINNRPVIKASEVFNRATGVR